MDASDKPLRIFVPVHLRWAASGYLVGCYSSYQKICCVVAIVHAEDDQIVQCAQVFSRFSNSAQLSVLGCLENVSLDFKISQRERRKPTDETQSLSLLIKSKDCEITDVQFLGAWKSLERGSLLVYYEPASISKSVFLSETVGELMKSDSITETVASQNLLNFKGNVDFVVYTQCIYKEICPELKGKFEISPIPGTEWRLPIFLVGIVQALVNSGFRALEFANRLLSGGKAWRILNKPAVLCQLNYRWTVIKESAQDAKKTACDRLRFENAISQQIFDLLLGVLVMFYFLRSDFHTVFAEQSMSSADWIASELQVLLKWMMGFPAGLKLNSQLDSLLGRFFLYHIYLWTGYLQVLRPILSTLLWYICVSGCLGITTQLCLVQDLISMMTLHIYCFYVYAARLYNIQMRGLASLWRLFRGKKWNVLRKRVDSMSFDVDQLFLGTLLFTILLFLLPTTALYYIVFTALRLLVLVVQGSLHKIVSLLNALPVQSLLYRIASPETVSDGMYFTIYSPSQTRVPLSMNIQLVPASLLKLWQHSTSIRQHQTYSWKNLGSELYWGKLIYPWIEPEK